MTDKNKLSQSTQVIARYQKETIPTYVPRKAQALPMFFEKKPYQGASGKLYPIPYMDTLSNEKTDKEYRVALLENEYIRIRVLPEIGGKIQQAYDKTNDYDFVYHNTVIKPAMIGLAGPWVSGGIEFNWPQHHRPTTYMPLESTMKEGPCGEKTVWVGEVDYFHRMKGMAGMTLCPGRSYVKVKVRLYNRTPYAHPFMWWANTAVAVHEKYRIVFPPDVAYVNDHDRRAVIGWPIAKGVYKTARPFDYGSGTDLSWYPSVVVPTSFMASQGQTDMDFLSGYDHKRSCGVVTVADHHIAPGKKLFHWGYHDFGNNWCANLTDTDGPYVELMTGVFSDNQPDFTWIHPYETKSFEQYWYPIYEIGEVKNATLDAAVNLEVRDRGIFVGLNTTGVFPKCRIKVRTGDRILFEDEADMEPGKAYSHLIEQASDAFSADHLSVSVTDHQGRELVSYKAVVRDENKKVEPRKPAERPENIETIEELYINGVHLEQYKHHTYVPEDYYLEALKRDPDDSRCNTAMGQICMKKGAAKEASRYLEKAVSRLTTRNQHPEDAKAYYLLALCYLALGQEQKAYNLFQRAAWQYAYRSPAYYAIAQLEAKAGRYDRAIDYLDQSLLTNADHTKALCLKAALLRNLNHNQEALPILDKILEKDPLDIWPMVERCFVLRALKQTDLAQKQNEEVQEMFGKKPDCFLDVARDYFSSSLFYDAAEVLSMASQDDPLVLYYQAYTQKQVGDDDLAQKTCVLAEEADPSWCFPSQNDDLIVLEMATRINPQGPKAWYYLGCLYYDKLRCDEAFDCWERSVNLDPVFGPVHRNLALVLFDKRGDWTAARDEMETALRLMPDNPRVLYELQQLLKNANARPEERLALYEQHQALMVQRDDCYLDCIVLLTQLERYDEAIKLASQHRFHIYEGGEGQLTRHHAWLHVLKGIDQLMGQSFEQAEETLQQAFILLDNYGEGKSYFAQENHIWYYLAVLYEQTGKQQKANEYYQKAAEDKDSMSEVNLYRALALKKTGQFKLAISVLNAMIQEGQSILANADQWPYFGVGAAMPMPFEYDIVKTNTIKGALLSAFGYLGLGQILKASEEAEKVRKVAPYHFQLHLFDKLCDEKVKKLTY